MTGSFLSPTFVIGQLRIGSVEGASCVNLGNNYPAGFQSYKKHNQGFGNIGGDGNRITGARTVLDDADGADLFPDGEANIPEWVKRLAKERAQMAVERINRT